MIILFAVVFFNLLSLPCDRMEVEAEQGMISLPPPHFFFTYFKKNGLSSQFIFLLPLLKLLVNTYMNHAIYFKDNDFKRYELLGRVI